MTPKKLTIYLICGFAFLTFGFPIYAQSRLAAIGSEVRKIVKEDKNGTTSPDLKERILNKLSGTPIPGLRDRVKNVLSLRMLLGTVKLTALSGTTLTVTHDGKSYTVNTGTFDKCTTVFERRFWGKADISEFTVGDILNIAGYWTDDTQTSINACRIRNTSIQRRYGVFIGEIKSVSDSGFVMSTISDKRADQTVTVSSTTKFINRKGEKIVKADILVGQKVRVRGLWDRIANTITEVTEVKDFSLPLLPTKTVSPTPTPAAL